MMEADAAAKAFFVLAGLGAALTMAYCVVTMAGGPKQPKVKIIPKDKDPFKLNKLYKIRKDTMKLCRSHHGNLAIGQIALIVEKKYCTRCRKGIDLKLVK